MQIFLLTIKIFFAIIINWNGQTLNIYHFKDFCNTLTFSGFFNIQRNLGELDFANLVSQDLFTGSDFSG